MNAVIENNLAAFLIPVAVMGGLAVLLGGYLLLTFRRYRRDHKIVMGEGRDQDLIAHARAVQQRVDEFSRDIRRLSEKLDASDRRLADCLTFRSVVRYDAYRDLSGMQSTSVALLDAHFSGIIVSSIQSRDYSRLYVKEVRHGESKEKLSPEEIHVLKEAMGLKAAPGRRAVGGEAGA